MKAYNFTTAQMFGVGMIFDVFEVSYAYTKTDQNTIITVIS